MSEERELDPTTSLGFILNLKLSRVAAVRQALSDLEGVHIIISKLGPPRSLWITVGDKP